MGGSAAAGANVVQHEVPGLGFTADFDKAQGDFDFSVFVGPEDGQHELFGFAVVFSGSVVEQQDAVGLGLETASAASTSRCLAGSTLLVISTCCSVEAIEGTFDLTVVVVASFGPQQLFPQAMMYMWSTKVRQSRSFAVKFTI